MLTRRRFGACLICAGIGGFAATAASAQGSQPVSPITRKLLRRTENGSGNLVTLLMEVEVPAGVEVPRHTHPGIESAFVLAGEAELYCEGREAVAVRPGEGFQIPPETPHGVRKVTAPLRLAITYVVDKDKPLLTLAPG